MQNPMSSGAPCTWRKTLNTGNKGFQCLGQFGREGWGTRFRSERLRESSSIKKIGRYRWGWGAEANELQMDRWVHTMAKGRG